MQKILLFLCLVAFSHAVQSTKVSAREPEANHPPLPHTVSAWLEKHAATLGPTTSPPKGWRILESQSGDLNGDGRNDFAVVLEEQTESAERPDAEGSSSRRIVVLLAQAGGSLRTAHVNLTLVLDGTAGGVFGDPFEGISIENGSLVISHYGGSNFRWSWGMEFRYVGGLFRLTGLTHGSMYTGTANGEETVCDFLRGTVERRASGGPEDGALLYSGNMESKIYTFDQANFDEVAANVEIPFLPDLGYYDYDRIVSSPPPPPRLSPGDALDRVKEARYPHYLKAPLPLTPAMLRAYAKLLGYEIPGHRYQGSDGELEYHNLDIADDGKGRITGMTHVIQHKEVGSGRVTRYEVDDAGGTVRD